jgi:PiT family inorganic phosphate transporter
MDYNLVYLILGIAFGFFMAWGIGASDVANAMGTSIGARVITPKQALLVAAVFEFAGALFASGNVTATFRDEIIKPASYAATPELLVYGMLSSLLAAGIWLAVACSRGWPVSTTHTIMGAIVGFGAIALGVDAINWQLITDIVISWMVTPIIAGVFAFLLFRSVQRMILDADNPIEQAKRYIPLYIFTVTFIISLVTTFRGLAHIGWSLTAWQNILLSLGIGLSMSSIGIIALRRIKIPVPTKHRYLLIHLERIFGVMMVFTACSMAFAHGSNDVANAVGPLAAIVHFVQHQGALSSATIPTWILYIGAFGIVLGLATYGYKVITTIGTGITELTPSRGFAAELSTATVVVLASGSGYPISTTQTLVGALLGVGFARGVAALNLITVRNIFLSWLVTIPIGATLSVLFFYIFKAIFLH